MATYIGANNVNAIYHGSAPLTGVYHGVTQITPTVTTTPDPYFSDVVLLLQDSLTDESPQGQTITALGGASFTTTNPKVGTHSLSLLAAGDSAVLPSAETASLGDGDFTFEAWIYIPSLSGVHTIYDARTSGQNPAGQPVIAIDVLGRLSMEAGGVQVVVTPSNFIVSSKWAHIALVRGGIYVDAYINGTRRVRTINTASFSVGTSGVRIGGSQNNTNYFLGYLDALRITKGVARYTSNFTLPTSAFPATNGDLYFANVSLLLQDSLTDESPKGQTLVISGDTTLSTAQVKVGSHSIYFDDTGDRMTAPAGPPFTFGTGDYTVETWIYILPHATTDQCRIPSTSNASSNFSFEVLPSGALRMWTGSSLINFGGTAVTQGAWHHVAFCRASSVIRAFVDGNQIGSAVGNSTNVVNNQNVQFPSTNAYRSPACYLDAFRVTKAARYTSNFTPPTAAFPN